MTWQKKFLGNKVWIIVIIILVGFSLISGILLEKWLKSVVVVKTPTKETVVVTKVVDGDTIDVKMVDGKVEIVRLLGIDSPELNDKEVLAACFALMAKEKLAEKVLNGEVRLESDDSQGDRDKYGRLLRQVYYQDQLINAWLVREGLARVYNQYPVKKTEEFRLLESEAKKENKGLWRGWCQ